MRIKNKDLNINELAQKWDASGCATVYHDGESIYRDFFGYADRETKEPISEESTYLLSGCSHSLLSYSLLLLEDMKMLKIRDTVDKYIPEYEHSSKISIKHLMQGESGMRDYFYGVIMPKLKDDEKHNSLDDKERLIKEKSLSTHSYKFEEILNLIGAKPLEYEPGVEKGNYTTTEIEFCKEIIERVSGLNLQEFQIKYIFEPLSINVKKQDSKANTKNYVTYRDTELIHVPVDETASNLFVVSYSDIEKLMLTLYEGKLFSKKTWKKALSFNKENIGLGFEMVAGTVCCTDLGLLGYKASIYFNRDAKLCYMQLSNCDMIVKNINGTWMFFRKEVRNEIDALFTYPKNTRIVPYSKKIWYDVLNLEISKEQYEFVCDAKQSIAFAFAYKDEQKLFVGMEGDKPVGLMVLQANKKKKEFHVSILLVDKRYQGRGFGKIMLKWGVEYLKNQGAKELSIGVNRFNVSAQHLYKSVGFMEDLVYEEGILMKMIL